MAVNLGQLAAALRLTDGSEPPEPVASILNRYMGIGEAYTELEAPLAPVLVRDEAVIRMAGYLYDSPPAAPGTGFSNAWRNSGAALLVSRWRVLRIEPVDGAEATAAGEVPIPTTGGLNREQVQALIDAALVGVLSWGEESA